jgi:hypothetical protein
MSLVSPSPMTGPRSRRRAPLSGRIVLGGVAMIAVSSAAASAQNLLVDPSFELNPLDSYTTVLNNFPGYQGVWGVENSSITGAVGGVTPPDGINMLGMFDDSLTITQAWQVTDVSANPFIPSGTASFTLGALFNVEDIPAARASVFMQFFSGPGLGFEIPGSQLSATLTLDNNASTWETISVTGSIPAATTWMVSQVGYWNSSMGGEPGYVDVADFRIIPAPGSVALLGAGGLLAMRRRR